MNYQLNHPVCRLNITNEYQKHLSEHEYKTELFSILVMQGNVNTIVSNGTSTTSDNNCLSFVTPFQSISFVAPLPQSCIIIQFNADLFCIEKHDAEIGCNGILFNNVYEAPMLNITNEQMQFFNSIIQQMCLEINANHIGNVDMLESYIKQFLVQAVRIKKEALGQQKANNRCAEYAKLIVLKQLINDHYKEERKLKFYADALCVSESGLHKLISKHMGQSFTDLLYQKIIIDAKKQLFTTNNSVKEISYDLGFNDPAYFNRFFKKQCTITPEHYRKIIRNSAA